MTGIGVYYFGAISLILIGLYAILTKRNLLKILVGLSIMETGVNLLLISVGYIRNATAPILSDYATPTNVVDPIPQALVLTAIVIGVATTALALSVAINVYECYRTLDVEKIRGLRG